MATCILVLKDQETAYELLEKLKSNSTLITNFQVIEPSAKDKVNPKDPPKQLKDGLPKTFKFKDVKLFNPKLSQKERQKKMSLWLMPFGFIAGLTFAGMTNLNTFSKFGINPLGETFTGGLLGMTSGWIGSFFAARSVNTSEDELKSLRKRNEQGLWLVVLETPFEIEVPWQLIKEIEPIEIVNLNVT
ncbi:MULTISPECIES: hypothetical protein [Prochlorococcus]|uniref:Uncharacterized conserved membrane protein n=1 Tax=Prochlorococcus marinus (strain SARG / CCMP1375 / SS120) TaxID=167539 RepID=Q7VAM3_PROMA|nr:MULTISPECIES: hypothetical protein [Prochlorococcus]AAQ00481.1 Uncharacterized conserved membrane protein [Prochlorococcus marinus subsp. marinus str. CCMP1375]KGG22064.1 hypothetical protein EV08_0238 [Prochlorococcus marinus str. SS2]KGG24618.1 hypothetical protein EV09_0250 [Prochlorococcus marinus str. SS35]KGG33511.1 hypothetical protein EV10_0720 [Prochlorococcus marinus str. SS51]KGG36252.1 hypothetical protein EV11_0943 [Prochlorococcus sp. SS52]